MGEGDKGQILEERAAHVLRDPTEYGDHEAAEALGKYAAEHSCSAARGEALVEIGRSCRLRDKNVQKSGGERVGHAAPAKTVQRLRAVGEEEACSCCHNKQAQRAGKKRVFGSLLSDVGRAAPEHVSRVQNKRQHG